MSAVSGAVSGVAQVAEAVAELAGRISDRGAEIERAGRLPGDVVAGLRASGVFRLWLPRELGGLEAAPSEVLPILIRLAEADASTGWCAATGIASNTAGAYLSEPAARELFGTGDELVAGALMPGGRAVRESGGGFRLDGRWSFGSGTQHSDWVVGGAVVADEPGARSVLAMLMPVAEVEFLDTWQVAGLEGTGSVDYQVRGLPVPAEHAIELATMRAWPAGAMWRIPLRSLLYPVLAAVPLGIGRRAVRELTVLAGIRTKTDANRRMAEQDLVQLNVARARALVESGAGYLSDSLQALADAAALGEVPSAQLTAQARLAAAHATDSAAEAVLLCYRTAGSAALYRTSPLQRALRDVNAATQHYALSALGFQLAGQVLLGLEADPGL